jgi:hypothetical protein
LLPREKRWRKPKKDEENLKMEYLPGRPFT